jgi:hypothetical protein
MKKMKLSTVAKKIASVLLGATIVFTLNSCATKSKFLNSSVVPAAEGYIKVKKDANKNFVVKVEVYNLAEVERLQTSKLTYVVWIISGDQAARNIGRLNSSSSSFSKKLKASFETVSSSKPDKIFITAEDDGNIQYPNGATVLTTANL